MSDNCQICGLCEFCNKPRIRGRGNIENPVLLIIGECPGKNEDIEGIVFVGRAGKFLSEVLGDEEKNVFITNAVKCCSYKDPFDHTSATQTPNEQQIEWCKPFLLRELDMFDPAKTAIMTLGASSLTSLIGKHKEMEKEAGDIKFEKIGNKTWKIIPNYHPSYIIRGKIGSSLDKEFRSVVKQALNHNREEPEEEKIYLIADPARVIKETKLIIEAHKKGEIDYIVYDCETTGFLPWKDRIIMYSFFNSKVNEKAIAVPIHISNINHHGDDYPYKNKIVPIEWELSVRDIAKINRAMGEMIEVVPVVCHNCLQGNTPITLADGTSMYIKDIVNKKLPVTVMSYNFKTNKIEPKKVINWFKGMQVDFNSKGSKRIYNAKEWIKITTEYKTTSCLYVTPEHEVYTSSGKKIKAGSLKKGDELILKQPSLGGMHKDFIIGILLGDGGWHYDNKINPGISFSHSDKQKDYFDYKVKILKDFVGKAYTYPAKITGNRKNNLLYKVYLKRSFQFKFLMELYGSKREYPSKLLEEANSPVTLAVWYMDDGYAPRGYKKHITSALIAAHSWNIEEIEKICKVIKKKFNLEAKIKKHGKYFDISFNCEERDKFFKLVAPYIIPSMQYKIPSEYHCLYNEKIIDLPTKEISSVKITDIKKLEVLPNSYTYIKYDIEVEETHNFFAGKLLVSNCKFDIAYAVAHNIAKLENIKVHYDTLLLAHIIIGRLLFGALDLKTLCVKIFGVPNWEIPKDSYLKLFRKLSERTYDKVPTSILGEYAAKDAYYTDALLNTFLKNKDIDTLLNTYRLLHNILPVFTEAEIKGIYFDLSNFGYIKEAYENMAKKEKDNMSGLIEDWIYPRKREILAENAKKKKPLSDEELEKEIFNPGSTQQRSSILFDFFKMKSIKKGKSGSDSSDKDVIDALLRDKKTTEEGKQFLTSLSEYTGLKKLITSYLDNTDDILDGNIYHPSYQINGTITGRHSSGFHTLPRGSDIKRLFVSRWAEEGGLFGSFDFSQLELRVVASLADEQKWLKAFEDGIDIHSATAAVCFGVKLDKVTSTQRKQAKTVNFGLIYGLSDAGLGDQLGITTKAAKKIKDGLFAGCTDLSNWFQKCYDEVNATHEVVTVFDRTIPINKTKFSREKDDEKEDDKEANQRSAVNYKVQSPASDLVTDSIGRIHKVMKNKDVNLLNIESQSILATHFNISIEELIKRASDANLKSIIVGSVHDSILFDIYPGELVPIIKLVKHVCEVENRIMYPWIKCPITVDASIGTSWGGCLDFDVEYTDKGIKLTCKEGLRKDFRMLFYAAEKIYKWEYTVLKETEIKEEDQPKDKVIRDRYNWAVEILI
jgi:uracil-DNA glycosylase family 4